MKHYIGIDLHKDIFTACYLDQSGKEKILEFKLSQLKTFKKTLGKEDEIAVEAVANSRYFCDEVVQFVEKVVMVAPGQFKVISSSIKKTDKNDAKTIATYLSKGLLPEARIMTPKQARMKSLVGTRAKLVNQNTAFKNKIHNILSGLGIPSKKGSFSKDKGLDALMELPLDRLARMEIEILVNQIKNLNQAIEKIEKELADPQNQLPGHENLASIKGIGDVGAAVLMSVIGDVSDFPDKKKVAAYFGLVPSVKMSNDTIHYGRITKRGSKIGRTILVQCALIAMKNNPYLKDFYDRLKKRRGGGKAKVATARKLLDFIYLTLSQNIIWEDSNLGIIKS